LGNGKIQSNNNVKKCNFSSYPRSQSTEEIKRDSLRTSSDSPRTLSVTSIGRPTTEETSAGGNYKTIYSQIIRFQAHMMAIGVLATIIKYKRESCIVFYLF
jgi:hypothetical protein